MKTQRRLLLAGVVTGVLLMLAPVVGVLRGLSGAFRTLTASGIGDPHSLAGSVAEILVSTAGFVPLAAAGLFIFVLSLVKYRQLRVFETQLPSDLPSV